MLLYVMSKQTWKIFVLIICFVLSSCTGSDVLKYIGKYFENINVGRLHLFLCEEEDGLFLLKHPPFSKFLSRINSKSRINWNIEIEPPLGFFIDFGCEFNKKLFSEVPESLLTLGFSWLVNGSAEDALGLFESLPLGLETQLVLLLPNLTLVDVYKVHQTSHIRTKKCASQKMRCPSKNTRLNLEGITLQCAALNFLQLSNNDEGKRKYDTIIRNKDLEPLKELFTHKYYILNDHLAYLYNYNISIVFADTYGYKLPNGSYNGMIHLLQEMRADITLTPMGMLVERVDIIDYTTDIERVEFFFTVTCVLSYFLTLSLIFTNINTTRQWLVEREANYKFTFVFREERTLGGVNALIVPFDGTVWLTNSMVFALSILVSSFIFYFYHPQNIISESFLNVIGVVCAQGVLEMNVTSSRVLNFSLLTLGLLLATYYNASIMNGLLSPTPAIIKDVKGLLQSRQVGISNISYMHPLFFHPLLNKKLKELKTFPLYEIPDGIKKLKGDNFALVGDGTVMYSEMNEILTDSEKCSTRRLGMSTGTPMTCVTKKNSHYTDMLKIGYAWLRESGIASRETKYWYPDPPHCLGGTVFKPVSFKSMTIAFCVYLSGVILSLVVLSLEKAFYQRPGNKQHKKPIPTRLLV